MMTSACGLMTAHCRLAWWATCTFMYMYMHEGLCNACATFKFMQIFLLKFSNDPIYSHLWILPNLYEGLSIALAVHVLILGHFESWFCHRYYMHVHACVHVHFHHVRVCVCKCACTCTYWRVKCTHQYLTESSERRWTRHDPKRQLRQRWRRQDQT